jgi:hypothetical protein
MAGKRILRRWWWRRSTVAGRLDARVGRTPTRPDVPADNIASRPPSRGREVRRCRARVPRRTLVSRWGRALADASESSCRTEVIMSAPSLQPVESLARYELRFQSLFHSGRGLAFPCDSAGEVLWDRMTERARESFLRAQQGVGRDYASPAVRLSDLH